MNRRENWDTELIHGTVAPGWEPVKEEFVQNECSLPGGARCFHSVLFASIYTTQDKVSGFVGRLQYRDREKQRPSCMGTRYDTMVPM
mmetsp:Transcript_7932/g.11794  ORF Transcript_7932/g.11794 Transcript_7932/m.11794 type:complete len:87 (-) Transcript_7932:1090-1350(-)